VVSASIGDDQRFAFGENWRLFLETIDEARITAAERSLRSMLQVDRLDGRSFLDIGCGSGLFSLAARNLGATVHSFDRDPRSVACAEELKRRYRSADAQWTITVGDALLEASGPTYDVVYSWGVLHHTGDLWRALELAGRRVKGDGHLFVALYNDQGWLSRYWSLVKRLYGSGGIGRAIAVAVHAPYFVGLRSLLRLLRRQGPLPRGMSLWRDLHDWLGGWPFEVASPAAVVRFCRERALIPVRVLTAGRRHGCNEFVFRRSDLG